MGPVETLDSFVDTFDDWWTKNSEQCRRHGNEMGVVGKRYKKSREYRGRVGERCTLSGTWLFKLRGRLWYSYIGGESIMKIGFWKHNLSSLLTLPSITRTEIHWILQHPLKVSYLLLVGWHASFILKLSRSQQVKEDRSVRLKGPYEWRMIGIYRTRAESRVVGFKAWFECRPSLFIAV